jgi:hypothetical protein
MIFGITNYSPLDLDTLLAGLSRTLSPNEKSDYFLTFSYTDKFKSKNCILFNSLEYCQKRSNVVILDSENTAIEEVVAKIKANK